MNNEFSSIETLIRKEQSRQNGQFIEKAELDEYINKIEKNAEFVTHMSAGQVTAFIAYYCNDPARRNAFITLVLTNPNFRGNGLARDLLQAVLGVVRRKGFKSCQLEVRKNNVAAMSLYKKVGFFIKEDQGDSWLMQRICES